MEKGYYEILEDWKRRDLEERSEMRFEINAFYGIENKIYQLTSNLEKSSALGRERSSLPRESTIKIPPSPQDVDIDENIMRARESFNPFWFIDMVKPHGPWDYKRRDPIYENFGNFNFGATAAAFGFMEKWALEAAGIVQIYQHKVGTDLKEKKFVKALQEFEEVLQGPPYGDDPKDQEMIKLGFRYYQEVYLQKYRDTMTTKEILIKMSEEIYMSKYPGSDVIARSILRAFQ